jgi:hypothetical protein
LKLQPTLYQPSAQLRQNRLVGQQSFNLHG